MHLEFFVLAGGGAAGWPASWRGTGGGGAGGLLIGAGDFPPAKHYDVIVGLGGKNGAPGGDSAIFNITNWVPGGGVGGPPDEGGPSGTGGTGGSGGGASPNAGGSAPGAGTAGLGYAGGSALVGGNNGEGGGGGGAGAVGGDGNTALGTEQPRGGTGGAGITHDFSGVSMPYAGGGGGGGGRFGGGGTGGSGHNVTGGSGGSGSQAGGGTGGAGKPNTGGGGGGGTENSPGNPGGSGIVMIRYPIPTLGAIFAAGGTITDLGNGYRLHTFLASANFEIIPPIIMGLAPDHGWQGQSIAITITGTDFSATSKVSVGAGAVGVSGIVVLDKTTLQCTLTIPPTLAPGPYPLIVTTEAGPSAPQSFTVNASGSGMFIVM